jgi:adenylate kinase
MVSSTTPTGPLLPNLELRLMRRLLLVGPPGAGKSSQGVRLAARLGVSHVSTGALLRDEVRRQSPVGRRAAVYMSAGRLVPDWLVLHALELKLSSALDVGFVLDGYPRTLEQAERFMRSLGHRRLDRVIELATPDEVVIRRLAGRAICDRCGLVGDSASPVTCTRCNGAMRQRADDDEKVVRSRVDTYHTQTRPMLERFRAAGLLVTIDGGRSRDVVASDLFRLIKSRDVHLA